MGASELLGKPNKLLGSDLQWTSIPSRGTRNTPSCFMLQKPGYTPAAMSRSGSKASLSFHSSNLRSFVYLLAHIVSVCGEAL